eukprot:TRINITY_DN30343_c0_g1_i1.p1 TRINITY_DN30343_c0_g1~~TRINITY_DN30343_c0_g1_i1.p1  ORF type:complete len:373 (+),score=-4.26 TRINITY_DN30343_c0_g1_i1:166-1284(+)
MVQWKGTRWCLLALVVVALSRAGLTRASTEVSAQSLNPMGSGNLSMATYYSNIFDADVSILVDDNSISLKASPPPNFKALFGYSNPMYEAFPLPKGGPKTVFNHVGIMYNPFGAEPFLAGQQDPTPINGTYRANETCLTCYVYVTFFFIDPLTVNRTGSGCAFNENGFCSFTKGTDVFQLPRKEDIPSSFSTSSGTMYRYRPLLSPFGSKTLAKYVLSPLAAPRIGLIWTSKDQPPALYGYGDKYTLGPVNYYASSAGRVIGVGQAVSTTYFDLYASFFSTNIESIESPVNTGPFDLPDQFPASGLFPTAAFSQVNGYLGRTTFTFGFANFTQVTSMQDLQLSQMSSGGQRHASVRPLMLLVLSLVLVLLSL